MVGLLAAHQIPQRSQQKFLLTVQIETIIRRYNTIYKMKHIIKVKEHGTAYFIDKYGQFAGYPMLKDGGLDKEGEFEVEQSPSSYKSEHERVLRKLGVPKGLIPVILKHVHYG